MIVGFTATCSEFESCSWRDVLDTTLCENVRQWLSTARWFSPGTLVFSSNKTDHHNISDIILKVALNSISLKPVAIYISMERRLNKIWHAHLCLNLNYNFCSVTIMNWKCLYQVRVITIFTVFRLLTDFVCLYAYEFWLSLWKIVRSSVILLLPIFTVFSEYLCHKWPRICSVRRNYNPVLSSSTTYHRLYN